MYILLKNIIKTAICLYKAFFLASSIHSVVESRTESDDTSQHFGMTIICDSSREIFQSLVTFDE